MKPIGEKNVRIPLHKQPEAQKTGKFGEKKVTERLEEPKYRELVENAKSGGLVGDDLQTFGLKPDRDDHTLENLGYRKKLVDQAQHEFKSATLSYKKMNELLTEKKNLVAEEKGVEDLTALESEVSRLNDAVTKARTKLNILQSAISVSDDSIRELQAGGPSVAAAVALGDAVDAYKKAVSEMIHSKDSTKKQELQEAVNSKMTVVQDSLVEVKKGFESLDTIDSQIYTLHQKIERLKAEPEPKHGEIARLSKAREGLDNVRLALVSDRYGVGKKDSETGNRELEWGRQWSGKRFETIKASIAEDGVASKYLESIRKQSEPQELNELNTGIEKLIGDTQTNLGALESVNHCAEELRHIDSLLAAHEGLAELKAENDAMLAAIEESIPSWALAFFTLFLGNLVLLGAQYAYTKKGEKIDDMIKATNKVVADLLGVPEEDAPVILG